MNASQTPHCDEALLYRYLDGDLDGGDRRRVMVHLDGCPTCLRRLNTLSAFGEAFRRRVRHATAGVDFTALEKTVVGDARRQRHAYGGRHNRFAALKTIVPAAMGAALLLFFGYSALKPPPAAPPSAVVVSFTGSTSSVMIFETPETRQTILWYTEDADGESESDGG